MTENLILPNFLIIGAARSGTTTLYNWLREHPDVYLPIPERPEPHFFLKSMEYEKGVCKYSERYFSAWKGQKAIGEKSTSYLYRAPIVAPRIKDHLPDVKLIALLRNPIDRAYSSYWFTVSEGLETLTFEEALDREDERLANPQSEFWDEVRPFAYIDRGHYLPQLRTFLEHFQQQKLWIGIFDDLVENPSKIFGDILRFLQLDEGFTPGSFNLILNVASRGKPPMGTATRKRLLHLFFQEIQELSVFIGRDLSYWLS